MDASGTNLTCEGSSIEGSPHFARACAFASSTPRLPAFRLDIISSILAPYRCEHITDNMSVDIETLRGEIKAWEKAFADTHNGKRPSRNDVKRDETIGGLR